MRLTKGTELRALLAGLILALSPAAAVLGYCDTTSATITGDLMGLQNLPQFNPILGTLNVITFNLTSTATGTVSGTGVEFINPIIFPPVVTCMSSGVGLAMITPSAFGPDGSILGASASPYAVPGSDGCGEIPFSLAENPPPGLIPYTLANYIGTGNAAFSFSVTNAIAGTTWFGTFQAVYDFTPAPPTVPELSTFWLSAIALGTLAAWRGSRHG